MTEPHSRQDDRETISRGDLIRVIDTACWGVSNNARAKLRAVAETTDAVAVGWFHCDGVGCPVRQAGRRTNQLFQQAFDTTMARRYERDPVDGQIEPFVVEVIDD